MSDSKLAARLLAWRTQNALSLAAAGRVIGVDRSTVLRWEQGQAPRGLQREALTKALRSSPAGESGKGGA